MNPMLWQLLIATAVPTAAALLALWRQAAVNAQRHKDNTERLERIETSLSSGPQGTFVTRREFDLHAETDSQRFDLINTQLADIRHLLEH